LHEDRLDIDLLVGLASGLPHIAVVLIGPDALSAASRRRLLACPGITIAGPRRYSDLPGYLQHADVLIVPHVVSEFTESLDPIKAYECLASGRPTVATPVAGFRGLPAPVIVTDRDSFASTVDRVLTEPTRTLTPVDLPSWSDRADTFASALSDAQSNRRRPFVVYIDHCAKLSGGEIALARLLEALHARAHVILAEDGPLVGRLTKAGATVEVLPLRTVARDLRRTRVRVGGVPPLAAVETVRYTLALAGRLRELRPDLVHTNSLKAAVYGGIAARFAGLPVLIHIRDRIAPDYLPSAAVRLIRTFLRLVPDAVIANSQATLETLHLPTDVASVVPSPVVYDATPQVVRERHDSSAPFTVVMIGRLSPWKGQDVFIDAFAQAFPDGNQRALIVGGALFGEDGYADTLARQVGGHGLADRVELTGFREDVVPYLQAADVLVHASTLPEPFGQVVIEGLAAGLAVIATNAGGPAEIIVDGETGLLVPPGDRHGLADALRLLAEDEELRDRLRRAGRRQAERFTPEKVAELISETYGAILSYDR
jgi:glycosyltransferase involved in cell wall biosynthesis